MKTPTQELLKALIVEHEAPQLLVLLTDGNGWRIVGAGATEEDQANIGRTVEALHYVLGEERVPLIPREPSGYRWTKRPTERQRGYLLTGCMDVATGDPDVKPHRKDDPAVVEKGAAGESDVAEKVLTHEFTRNLDGSVSSFARHVNKEDVTHDVFRAQPLDMLTACSVLPPECFLEGKVDPTAVLRWAVPTLSEERAAELGLLLRAELGRDPLTTAGLQAFVAKHAPDRR